MAEQPRFSVAYNIQSTIEERREMAELYQRAFSAKRVWEDDMHVGIEIGGVSLLLAPGDAEGKGLDNPLILEVHYDDKDKFLKAYETLAEDGPEHSMEGPYPWATRLGLVTDKFGIGWALYYDE